MREIEIMVSTVAAVFMIVFTVFICSRIYIDLRDIPTCRESKVLGLGDQ